MSLYAYYVLRGWTIDNLLRLSASEKLLLHYAAEEETRGG